MTEQSIRFRLGIFVLAAILILGIMITLFGGLPTLFRVNNPFTVVFPNANGIAVGTPVKKSGVKIGEVRDVKLDDLKGKVNVEIDVDKQYTLRKSDRATLVTALLGGDSFIAFVPPEDEKKIDETPVPPGTTLIGFLPPDPGMLLQKTGELMPPAQEALVNINRVFQRIDKEAITDLVNILRKVDKMMPTIDETIKEFKNTTKEFGIVGKQGQDVVPKLGKMSDEMTKVFEKLDKMMPQIEETTKDLQKTIRQFGDVAKSTNDMMPKVDRTVGELEKLTKAANKSWPQLDRDLSELESTLRTWTRVGDRVDVVIQANEAKVVRAIEDLQRALKRAGDLLDDDNLLMVRQTLKNARDASVGMPALVKNTDMLMQDARVTVRRADKTMASLEQSMADLAKVTGPIGERAPSLLKNVDEAAVEFNKTMVEVRKLMEAISRNDGTVQKLITDPSLYNNLNDSALMVTRILPRLDRAMKDFETFADKIARHPETLGVGGAIRPSSGVKDGSSAPGGLLHH
jgi:phospholipid/cholesterol/gamma-HCH transport system substrate-binding protein